MLMLSKCLLLSDCISKGSEVVYVNLLTSSVIDWLDWCP
jgi:hypothetical protein